MIVDETANLEDAANKIFLGKTFDNATSCSSENSVIIQESIFDTMVGLLKSHGGYLCNDEEKARLKDKMWPDGYHLSKHVVGQPAKSIAELAGIATPDDVKFLMVIGESVGPIDM